MPISDLSYIFQWWILFFVIGILFFPFTSFVFRSFIDRGYIFAKVFGMVTISYVLFALSTLHILPFTYFSILLAGYLTVALSLLPIFMQQKFKKYIFSLVKNRQVIMFVVIEEIIFLLCLTLWSFIRSHQPDIHGLEKYMDFGFVNSILKTDYFPAKDLWLAPFSINYYYFGHLITAVLTKLSMLSSAITYNLMIATLFAFAFSCSFSIGINLISRVIHETKIHINISQFKKLLTILFAGGISAFLLSLSGNLHAVYTFFKPYSNENPIPFWGLQFLPETFPNAYWYPNATRFIHNTIHEFPIYSFVVSDLHGHVIGIPIVLTIVAILLHEFLFSKTFSLWTKILLSFLLACAYMTNALDGPIYLLLTLSVITFHLQKFHKIILSQVIKKFALTFLVLVSGLAFFSLPFSLHFNSFVNGIGVLCAPDFLTNFGKIGPFLFEPQHCQKSPLWQLLILHGFFMFWTFILWFTILRKKIALRTDLFVAILCAVSFLFIIIPEFFYFKDIYPAHYRANTMFKLTYQSFMLLSLASGYTIVRVILNIKIGYWISICAGIFALFLVSIYPYFAINSYYENLKTYRGLNGVSYLKTLYPQDFTAIEWLRENIPGQPIILEAQGDSYTDYARVSTHTGLPTVLGWTVHEWLWRGSYNIPSPRIADVQTLYESKNIFQVKNLIQKYEIQYIFFGQLERQKYPSSTEEMFQKLGSVVYKNNGTTIYKIN